MALQMQVLDIPLQVSANAVTIAQYAAVDIDASGSFLDAIYPSASGHFMVGVNQSAHAVVDAGSTTPPACKPGDSMQVRVLGITKAIAASAISIGDLVSVSGSSGQFATAAAAGATNTYVVGKALSAAGAAGDVFTLLLFPGMTTQVNA